MKKLIFILSVAVLFPSCATILAGNETKIHIKGVDPARAEIYYNGSYVTTAPGTVLVKKGAVNRGANVLYIKSPGYKDQTVILHRHGMVGFILLDILCGVVPLIVDIAAGTITTVSPKEINYKLEKQ